MHNLFLQITQKIVRYWLPLAAAALCLVVTLVLWQALRINEQATIKRSVELEADNLQHDVETNIKERTLALERMADSWALHEGGTPRTEWESDAHHYISDFSGFRTIVWIDREFHLRWVAPLEGNEKALNVNLALDERRRNALETAREKRISTMSRVMTLAQGGRGFVLYAPIYHDDQYGGIIGGSFHMEKLLDKILNQNTTENYAVTITDDGDDIYRRDENVLQGTEASKFSVTREIELHGVKWMATVTPKRETFAALNSMLDEISLIVGVLFSIVLGLAGTFAQKARVQTRIVETANEVLAREIYARRVLEKDLRASDERFKAFMNNNPAIAFMKDEAGRYVYLNETMERVFAVKVEELIGKTDFEWLPETVAAEVQRNDRKVLETNQPLEIVEAIAAPDNAAEYWLSLKFPVVDDSGAKFVGGVAFDITEKKRAEKALLESEKRNRDLVDKSLGLICTHDLKGRLLSVNPAGAHALGYEPAEIIGNSLSDFMVPEAKKGFLSYLAQVSETGESRGLMHVLTKSGESRIWKFNNALFEDGAEVHVLGHAQDITDIKHAQDRLSESEEKYRLIVETTNEWVWAIDSLGLSTYNNPAVENILGYTPEEVHGDGYFSYIFDEDRQRIAGMLAVYAAEKCGWSGIVSRWHHKNGEIRYLESNSVPILNEKGEVVGFSGADRDITERKLMEQELEKAHDAALESARLKSEFLANMSHEIRTPMNGVIGMTDLLLDTQLNRTQHDYAEIIKISAEGLMTIINDILDFSKIEAGKLNFEMIDFDLRAAVENTIELFAEPAANKRIELASLVEADVPTALRGDPGRLRQILTNLLGNSIKFTEKGETIVRVCKESESEHDVALRFSISDTGIGINQEAQKYLFQAFVQADGSTTRRYGGTGLGLAISKQLVEMMNGEIRVSSEAGKGSTFTFTARFEKQPIEAMKTIVPLDNLKNLRLLVVDDNATNRKIMVHQTAAWGIDTDEAEDGETALAMLKMAAAVGAPYHLAILDLMMPEMDGFDVARTIKADAELRDVRLILMPSFGQRGHGKIARQTGINAYLIKPVRQSDLHDCIISVMGETHVPLNKTETRDAPPKFITRHVLEEKRHEAVTILVAEDNVVNQKVAKLQLERLGYRAVVVNNGSEAIEAMARNNFALVLMDCQMPVMDGYAAATEIRSIEGAGKHTPIVAVTANAMTGEREKCVAAGMDDYLAKPFKQEELSQIIKRWLTQEKQITTDLQSEITALLPTNEESGIFAADIEIRLSELESEVGEEMIETIIMLFLEDSAERLAGLREITKTEDAREIQFAAHGLKGSCANIGANEIVALCAELEIKARTGRLEEANSLIDKIETNFFRLEKVLNQRLTVSTIYRPVT
jgi:PAS domain S-box-containing protein